jgi:branched-chain amino acid transport system permease protein
LERELMEDFIQLTVTGLANGAILALAALGFVLIYKATGVINFAQGQFLVLGAYVIWAVLTQLGWHWALGILVAVLAAIVLGLVVERTMLRPLVGRPIIAVIMVTIGLAEVLRSGVLIAWGTRPRPFPDFIPAGTAELFGVGVPVNRLWAIGIAVAALAAFTMFFRRSKRGIAMRAVAGDQQAALVMGISVRRIFALAWALAGISAVAGGMLIANLVGVSGLIGSFGLLVFPVVILGGLDSVPGAMVGGAIIGVITSYTGGYIGQGLQTVVPYVVLVLILLIKPYGLFGEVRIERV